MFRLLNARDKNITIHKEIKELSEKIVNARSIRSLNKTEYKNIHTIWGCVSTFILDTVYLTGLCVKELGEAYYPCPGSHQKKSSKISQP